jgi:ketosteroid isomerase-like protein
MSVQDKPRSGDSTPFVRLEDYTRGPLFVARSATARANKKVFERHLNAEWASDIEGTMVTIHPDSPFQKIPALGVDVHGFEGIRQFYTGRFASWPGPALRHFARVAVTDTCIYVEGRMEIQTRSEFRGLNAPGKQISAPVVIVVEFRDELLSGETVYMDGAAFRGIEG